jgi:hypothetical protein
LRSVLAAIMAVLGTVLILSGAAGLWAVALTRPRTGETTEPGSRMEALVMAVGRIPGPERLIVWGVVLLALSAVASGAISLSVSAAAGNS